MDPRKFDSEKLEMEALSKLAPKMRTYDIFHNAIQEDAEALIYLKDSENRVGLKDGEYNMLCEEAINKYDYSALTLIDPSMVTSDWLFQVLPKNRGVLNYVWRQKEAQEKLKDEGKYLEFFESAIKKYGFKDTFRYLPLEMRTYTVCCAAAKENVNVLNFLKNPKDRPESLTSKDYADLCLIVIENQLSKTLKEKIDPASKNALKNFIARYESINKHLGYKMDDLGIFFSTHISEISDLYSLLGKNVFTLMEKLMKTSGDNLNRFLVEIKDLRGKMLEKASKNISCFLENIDYKNAIQKASHLKLYLFLLPKEKEEINKLINELVDDNLKDREKEDREKKILERIKGSVIGRFYNGLKLPYNSEEKNVMHVLSNEQIADLYGLFAKLQDKPNQDKSKMFFSLLKMHLTGIRFENLHQPDKMRKTGDEYMVQMATHNQELRKDLAMRGIDVNKAFSYGKKDKEKQPLEYDEHQRQKILELLGAISAKILEILNPKKAEKDKDDAIPEKTEKEIAEREKFIVNNPHAINKLNRLIKQIQRGKGSEESKLLGMLTKSNFELLIGIVFDTVFDSVLPNIKEQFLELTKLLDINDQFLTKQADIKDRDSELEKLATRGKVLENYKPKKYHIEMWDKSKFETFFLGDYLSCCLATTGTKGTEYAPRIFDDAFLMPVIIDESTNKPVCGAWLFLGEVTQPPSNEKKIGVVANFFEINAGIAENKELMNFLVVNLLHYIGQFSDSINASEFIMRPLTYGHVPDFDTLGTFTKTENRSVEKIGGYLGDENYYLDTVTDTKNFYKYDPAKFSEQNRKLIALAPKTTENVSTTKFGFFATEQVSKTENPTAASEEQKVDKEIIYPQKNS